MAKNNAQNKAKKSALETAVVVEDALRSIASRVGEIFEEATSTAGDVSQAMAKDITGSLNNLSKVANQLAEANLKAAEGALKQADVAKILQKRQAKILAIKAQLKILDNNEVKKKKELNDELKKVEGYNEEFSKELKEQLSLSKKINTQMGATGAILGGLKKVAGKLGLSNIETAFSNANAAALSVAKTSKGLGGKFKVLGAGIKSLGGSLLSGLGDPVVMIGLLVKAFTSLLALGQKFSQYTADIGKAFLGMGADSKTVAKNLKNMAAGTEGLYLNFEEAKKALIGLNKVAGTSVEFSEAQIKNYQKLTHFLGLSEEAAQGLFKTSVLSGNSFEDVASEVGGVVLGLNQSKGLSLSLNDVLEEVSKASSTTRFNVGQTPGALAAAAFEAKRLGMTLDQVSSAAASSLDFESSIANELKAELLLGKDLNLEKLRYAALTGDTNTQAKELNRILAENIDSTEGNVIKQKALAESLGMSVEDMMKANDARILQNEISKKGITDRVKAEKALAILRSKGLTQEQALEKLAKGKLDAIIEEGKTAEASKRSLEQAKETLMVSLAPLAERIANAIKRLVESDTFKKGLTFMGDTLKFLGSNLIKVLKWIKNNPIPSMIGGAVLGIGKMALQRGSFLKPMWVRLSGKGLGGLSKLFKGKKGKPSMIAKGLQKLNPMNWGKKMGKSGLYKKSSKGIISKTLGKVSKSVVPKVASKNIGKIGAKLGAKAIGKSILKKIPGIGLLAGIGFGISRAMKGDYAGAALELASGGASLLPGAGTAASLAIDAGLAARDISKATSGGTAADFISRPGQPIQKFRKDDIVVGGTGIGSGGGNVDQLLKKILIAIEKGGDVYMDTNKVGQSLNIGERSFQ